MLIFFESYCAGIMPFSGLYPWPFSSDPRIVRSVTDIKTGKPYEGEKKIKDLEYTPLARSTARSWMKKGDQTIYDVLYSFDGYGFRKNFNYKPGITKSSLFFGCSFTFGDGVRDEETYPNRFEVETQNQFKSVNLAYTGYGAHQMLYQLEHQMERDAIENSSPVFAFYLLIPDHVNRTLGKSFWNFFGPRYIFNSKHEVVQSGRFHDGVQSFGKDFLMHSALGYELLTHFFGNSPSDFFQLDELDLFTSIVERSKKIYEDRYHGIFAILYWDDFTKNSDHLLERLKRKNFKIIDIQSQVFKGKNLTSYLIPEDGHPNAHAHSILARYLAQEFTQKDKDSDQ